MSHRDATGDNLFYPDLQRLRMEAVGVQFYGVIGDPGHRSFFCTGFRRRIAWRRVAPVLLLPFLNKIVAA